MATASSRGRTPFGGFWRWLFAAKSARPAIATALESQHHRVAWYRVVCLTGVDYFSTLAYQSGIAFLAAQFLSPIATLLLVLFTLCGALPVYCRVADESPHGEGSISMFGNVMSWWWAKLSVLVLLGFMGTDFIVTITLSAADAAVHMTENPLFPAGLRDHDLAVTLVLIAVLAALFLRGFQEAIGISVLLVVVYLALNFIVAFRCVVEVMRHPEAISSWSNALFTGHGSITTMIAMSVLAFPKLALGLSGFETGVAVMPLVKGAPTDSYARPAVRIANTKKMLTAAAVIMSVLLILTSFVTTLLIPAAEFQASGKANGRALAYLAHQYLGNGFGTVYDISTILILWFAGASAMAGIINIIPRYLPRYGMSPGWVNAIRPLILFNTAVAFVVTIWFNASVDAQAGAYATGVLFLMSAAAFTVMLTAWRRGERWSAAGFCLIWLIFTYTTVDNIIERPDGMRIASFFIAMTVIASLASRLWRTTELRIEDVVLDDKARQFILQMQGGDIRILANHPQTRDEAEYREETIEKRTTHHLTHDERTLILEVYVSDASDFTDVLEVEGVEVGAYRVLRAYSSVIPNSIAALLLRIRDMTGKVPHVYFHWGDKHPASLLFNYIVLGQGDVGGMTREVLRQAEPNVARRPVVHVAG